MAQAGSSPEIRAVIQGEITGQVAVGTQIVQIGSVHGGVVNLVPQPVVPRARPLPVYLRPRPFPQLLDRESEVRTISAAFDSGVPVEIYGPAGVGKTTLLRYLSHYSFAASFPDGVIHLSARMQPAADVLQSLYEAFHESDILFKATDAQIRFALRERRALVLIDDVEFPREELERLMDAAPVCTFLVASPERRLWGEVRAIPAKGLPEDAALALVERALEAPVSGEQREAAKALCAALEGHPLRILQAVALVRLDGRPLAEVAAGARTADPNAGPAGEVLKPLTEPEHRALAVLAVLRGAAVEAPHVGAIAEVPDVDALLERLLRRGLVQVQNSRYSVTPDLAAAVGRQADLAPWVERASAHFTAWAQERRKTPERILGASEALLSLVAVLVQRGRWPEALDVVRATEGAVALKARWGAWAELLGVGLEASRALNNPGAQAWALHQLGTRAMCLGEQATAKDLLGQALKIREAQGDRIGAAVTRHNLNFLIPPPPPDTSEPPSEPPSERRAPQTRLLPVPLLKALIVALPVTALLTGVGVWYVRSQQEPGALALSANSVPFGSVEVGTTSPPREITLTNNSSRPIRLKSVSISGAGRDFTVVADTCSKATIPSKGMCSVRITFAPGVEGERTATLTVQPDGRNPQTVGIGGTGAAPSPAAKIEPQRLAFGSHPAGASSDPQVITVTNAGRGRLRLEEVKLTGPDAAAFVKVTDECSNATLDGGGRCRATFRFVPQARGNREATFEIESNAAGSPHRVGLSGSAEDRRVAILALSPERLDFGEVRIGEASQPRTMTVTNTGTAPLQIRSIAFGGAHGSDYAKRADGCTGTTVLPGGTCRLTITFRPRGVGVRQAILTFESNAEGNPHVVRLGGADVPSSRSTVAPRSLAFGTLPVGSRSGARSMRLTNTGTQGLLVRPVSVEGPQASEFLLAMDRCSGGTVAPGRACTVEIAFAPAASGQRRAVLVMVAGEAGGPHRIPLSGTGERSAASTSFSVAPRALDFGSQEIGVQSPGRTLAVTNTGSGPLPVRRAQLGGVHAIDFTRLTDQCANVTLAPGKNCTITFAFRPSIAGERNAFVTILATGTPLRVPLRGLGAVVAALNVQPHELDFGEQEVGSTSPARTITLVNNGAGSLQIRRIPQGGDHAVDFARTGDTCSGASLGSRESCTITMTFTPRREGVRQAFLTVLTTHEQRQVDLTGMGGAARDNLEASPSTLDFGEQQVGSSSRARSVQVRNGGSRSLAGIRMVVAGPDRSDFSIDDRCGAVLGAAQSCVVTVTFTPRAGGQRTATIAIQSRAGQAAVTLGGTGIVARGVLVVRPPSVTFGEQTVGSRSEPRAITVINEGTGSITIRSTSVGGSEQADFLVQQRCLGITLGPNESCQITVSFVPRDRGLRNATILIATDDGRVTVGLSGAGSIVQTNPVLDVQPTAYDFGNVGVGWNGPPVSIRIANTGNAALTIQNVVLSGGDRDQFPLENRCSNVTINPQNSCVVSVFFRPRRAGRFTATLQISTGNLSSSVNLAGRADVVRVGVLTLNGPAVGFGQVYLGQSRPAKIVATNTGTGPMAINGFDLSGPDAGQFTMRHTCGLLEPGSRCFIYVSFAPRFVGERRAMLVINHNGQGQRGVALAGVGVRPEIRLPVRVVTPPPTPTID
ncbi:MAG: choice-of-anchor D domain-containing protein [Armatimonadota bacterium]